MTRNSVRKKIAVVLLAGFLTGCTDNIWQGEVASVNGNPITLSQVAALRNSTYFDWTSAPLTDFAEMRKQYGDALTNLVAVELVKQHLAKKKLSVTREEVAAKEALVRADYPPGTFEDILVSEAIDLEQWRFLLHNYLSVQRFLENELRRGIVIGTEEVAEYLREHPQEFVRPPWAYFFMVSGTDAEEVSLCADDLDKSEDPLKVQDRHPNALIREVRLDTPRLDPILADAVTKLRPGDLSSVFTMNGEFHRVLLLESRPERHAEPGDAYAQIVETLMMQKLHTQYNAWILNRLKKSKIKVSKQLLPHLRQGTMPTGSVSEPSGSAGAAL